MTTHPSTPFNPPILTPENSVVLLIDVQERLMPTIDRSQAVIENCTFLLDAAQLLGVPVLATEQYPRGLGATVPELQERLNQHQCEPFPKTIFSAWIPEIQEAFKNLDKSSERKNWILCGAETHICVWQTALDLLNQNFSVRLASDALGSHNAENRLIALDELRHQGCTVTPTETIVFQWLGDAKNPNFKQVSSLLKNLKER